MIGAAASSTPLLWPLGLYVGLVVLVVAGLMLSAHFSGERGRRRIAQTPYECGMEPAGPAHVRFSVSYYLIAMFFLIFDIEAVLVFAWAVALRSAGWAGLAELTLFIVLLLFGLAYLWREGGLDWGPQERRKPQTGKAS